ncbi:MAG: hydroxymethylbilane synthase [Myxococcota bacterium]|jgi:hydroxymethylbilane synthase
MHLTIGTRGSRLALWQAHHIQDRLRALGHRTTLEVIKTQGDRIDHLPFSKLEGKGFFTKELEDAQLDGRVDLAVHSMKDLPTEQPPGLVLAALVGRADARDVLIARPDAVDAAAASAGDPLPLLAGLRVGTSSARRQAQVKFLRSDLVVGELRGNVPTRVQKLRNGDHDAILLAAAGLDRLALDLGDLWTSRLVPTQFVPAPAQGMLAIQCPDRPDVLEALAALHDAVPAEAIEAERWLLGKLDGGCSLPFGCFVAGVESPTLNLFLAQPDRAPLVLALSSGTPQQLAERAWQAITDYRTEDTRR